MFTTFLLLKNNQTNVRPSEGTCLPYPATRQQLQGILQKIPKTLLPPLLLDNCWHQPGPARSTGLQRPEQLLDYCAS